MIQFHSCTTVATPEAAFMTVNRRYRKTPMVAILGCLIIGGGGILPHVRLDSSQNHLSLHHRRGRHPRQSKRLHCSTGHKISLNEPNKPTYLPSLPTYTDSYSVSSKDFIAEMMTEEQVGTRTHGFTGYGKARALCGLWFVGEAI